MHYIFFQRGEGGGPRGASSLCVRDVIYLSTAHARDEEKIMWLAPRVHPVRDCRLEIPKIARPVKTTPQSLFICARHLANWQGSSHGCQHGAGSVQSACRYVSRTPALHLTCRVPPAFSTRANAPVLPLLPSETFSSSSHDNFRLQVNLLSPPIEAQHRVSLLQRRRKRSPRFTLGPSLPPRPQILERCAPNPASETNSEVPSDCRRSCGSQVQGRQSPRKAAQPVRRYQH